MNSKVKSILKVLIWTIIGIILFIALGFCILDLLIPDSKPVSKIQDYGECLKLVQNKDKIKHFPKAIPSEATNVQLYCYPAEYSGQGELVLLKLAINKAYIQNELKSYSFLNSNTPIGTPQKIYFMPTEEVGIPNEDLTFYVLKDDDNEHFYKMYFPYFTGIGIDKNIENIVYYYIEPAD